MMAVLMRKYFAMFGAGLAALSLVALLVTQGALAVQPDEIMSDPALEARARMLSKELRCMVCQNQSIDDSDAPLAHDLRVLVRERLQAGDTDQQVIDFLTARYGEFVLLKPAFSGHTALLWLTPIGILVIGALGLAFASRRRNAVEPQLTAAEQGRLAEILADKDV
jgi:cytochrome c-type biogenesis protein CcmH